MEQSREERMQQRLRGAQIRQIKDVDFGLTIPTATAPAKSSSPALTGHNNGSPPQSQHHRRPSNAPPPPPTISISENLRPTTSHSVNDANTSAKRRRLDTDLPAVPSGRSTRSTRTPRPDIYSLVDDDPPEVPALGRTEDLSEDAFGVAVAGPDVEGNVIISDAMPEPTETPSVQLEQGTPIISTKAPFHSEKGHESLEYDIISSPQEIGNDSVAQSSEVETPVPKRKRKRGAVDAGRKQTKQATIVDDDDVDELSPEQIRHFPTPKALARDQTRDDQRDALGDAAEREEAEGIDDHEAAAILSKNRSQRKSLDHAPSPEDEIEGSNLPVPKRQRKRQRENLTRAEQRPAKTTKSTITKASRRLSGKTKLRAGSPIPVTVHRLTRATVYEEGNLDADILNIEISHRKRAGVNPIDVLSQICQEIVGSALETLSEGHGNCDDPALKREYMTKWQAVSAFGDEINARLVEHTINLDNTYALERRVKDENKKKLNLREEVLHIRAERERIALRMDEIRIRHENETSSSRELNALNTAVHDIEVAVERGKAVHPDDSSEQISDTSGIEILLKRVAGEASKKGDSGGLLRQIKEFNGFLERSALALEGRRQR